MSGLRRIAVALAGCAILLTFAAPAAAQEVGTVPVPLIEVSAGYTFMRDTTLEDEYPAGWYLSGGANLNQWFGLFAEATGSYRSEETTYSAAALRLKEKARVYTVMAGPRFFHKQGRIAPFGQVLVGVEHRRLEQTERWMDGTRGDYTWHSPDSTTFAIQPGGGVTVYLTETVGVRATLDYRAVIDVDDDDVRNELRVLTGFSFHWGRR
jgi:opacity protein-like surface antigen